MMRKYDGSDVHEGGDSVTIIVFIDLSHGPIVLWSYGPMVLWSYGPMVHLHPHCSAGMTQLFHLHLQVSSREKHLLTAPRHELNIPVKFYTTFDITFYTTTLSI